MASGRPVDVKKRTNLSLSASLVAQAKELGINISDSAEKGIAEAVKRRKRQAWLRENASAIASSNAYIDEHGLPLAAHRLF